MMQKHLSDAEFADRAFQSLKDGPLAVSDGLEARLMADFDAVLARRTRRPAHRFRVWVQAIHPDMKLWQPGLALTASLIIGLTTGALLPAASGSTSRPATKVQVAAAELPALAMSGDLAETGDE